MKFWVGVTDNKWFDFLSVRSPDEVNFWRPSGSSSFKAIAVGQPFLFKLHSPHNFISGGGFFVKHSNLPLSLDWEAFREKMAPLLKMNYAPLLQNSDLKNQTSTIQLLGAQF